MFRSGGVLSSALVAVVICAAGSTTALALDRDGRGGGGGSRYNGGHGGGGGGWGGNRGHSGNNFSFSISLGNSRGWCPPPVRYRPPPVRYCPPPVVIVPPCEPVYIAPRRYYSPPVVVVERPRPVYVEREVIVQAPPQVIERQVIVQREPAPTEVMVVNRPTTNTTYASETISTSQALATAPATGGFVRESMVSESELSAAASMPAMDRGLLYWRAGKLAAAQASLRSHLVSQPDDARAMRLLAVMMLDDGHDADAASLMLSAYRKDPSLASSSLDPSVYQVSAARWTQLRDAALESAQRSRTDGSWLLASVMLQSDNQKDLARDMLDRSRAAGLDSSVSQSMKSALSS